MSTFSLMQASLARMPLSNVQGSTLPDSSERIVDGNSKFVFLGGCLYNIRLNEDTPVDQ